MFKILANICGITALYIRENIPDQLALICWFVGFFTLASVIGSFLEN